MNQYTDRVEQANRLAELVAEQLAGAITKKGCALLVVAGGSTPELFLNKLSNLDIDWSSVIVIPTDERWVGSTHPRSNDRFLHKNLKINRASEITIVPLYVADRSPEHAVDALEARLNEFKANPDVCVLGMGEDAHIASLFPGAEQLPSALDRRSNIQVMAINASGAGEPRITLTLAKLLSATHLHLLICGPAKLETLRRARQPGSTEQMPVRAILGNDALEIHYAD